MLLDGGSRLAGAATPALLPSGQPDGESSRPGRIMLYAWTYLSAVRTGFVLLCCFWCWKTERLRSPWCWQGAMGNEATLRFPLGRRDALSRAWGPGTLRLSQWL